jgi:hypothetical protein
MFRPYCGLLDDQSLVKYPRYPSSHEQGQSSLLDVRVQCNVNSDCHYNDSVESYTDLEPCQRQGARGSRINHQLRLSFL